MRHNSRRYKQVLWLLDTHPASTSVFRNEFGCSCLQDWASSYQGDKFLQISKSNTWKKKESGSFSHDCLAWGLLAACSQAISDWLLSIKHFSPSHSTSSQQHLPTWARARDRQGSAADQRNWSGCLQAGWPRSLWILTLISSMFQAWMGKPPTVKAEVTSTVGVCRIEMQHSLRPVGYLEEGEHAGMEELPILDLLCHVREPCYRPFNDFRDAPRRKPLAVAASLLGLQTRGAGVL